MRITVFNQKGGVGKTTTTLNLAAAACRNGGQPLLLDLDPQCHLTYIHGTIPRDSARSLFGFYQSLHALDELAIPWEGIGRLVPSHQQLIKVDSIFGKGPAVLNKLRLGLEQLRRPTGDDKSDRLRAVPTDTAASRMAMTLDAASCASRISDRLRT